MQSTRLGTSRSEELIVTHGVPQGSILGPLLFSLYMNDLLSVVKFSIVESYTGDTKVYLSISSKDIDSCRTKVTEDLRLIAVWCCTNREFKILRLRTTATDKLATAHDQNHVTVHFSRVVLRLRWVVELFRVVGTTENILLVFCRLGNSRISSFRKKGSICLL